MVILPLSGIKVVFGRGDWVIGLAAQNYKTFARCVLQTQLITDGGVKGQSQPFTMWSDVSNHMSMDDWLHENRLAGYQHSFPPTHCLWEERRAINQQGCQLSTLFTLTIGALIISATYQCIIISGHQCSLSVHISAHQWRRQITFLLNFVAETKKTTVF